MSLRMKNRLSQGDSTPEKGNKGIYNIPASPHAPVVPLEIGERHRMLCSMFPGSFTPAQEKVVDYLMSLDDKKFRAVCAHRGATVILDHTVLQTLEKEFREGKRTFEPTNPDDDDLPTIDLPDDDDNEMSDAELVHATIMS